MIGFDMLKLISRTYTEDKLGQKIPQESPREVFARMESISQSEFFEAGRIGLRPSYKAVLSTALDYDGEEIAEYEGRRYAIYRTYETPYGQMELYLQRETGVSAARDSEA